MADKCYKCGTELTRDPIGYSPACAWCSKCDEIRDRNYDEEERTKQEIKQKAKQEVFDELDKDFVKDDCVCQYHITEYEKIKQRHLSTLQKAKELNSDYEATPKVCPNCKEEIQVYINDEGESEERCYCSN